MIILQLSLWLLVIIFFVWLDYYEIVKKHDRPNYLLENIIKGGLFILYGAFIWNTQNDYRTFAIFIYAATSYWILFDILLNSFRHLSPFYIGRKSGWVDRFAYISKTTYVIYWIMKVIAVILCIQSIRYIYNH